MTFTKLVPGIFYSDVKVGLKLFVDCLGFAIGHDELNSLDPFCEVVKDGIAILIFQNAEIAAKDRPELRLHTDNIEEAYGRISLSHPELLHPNLSKPILRPWGAREFALADESGVCIIIQQWREEI